MRTAFVVSGLIALTLTVVSAADTWPYFRPYAGVVADDPMLPDTWGTRENVAWKVAVPGLGWGSPIVWGDHVFVTSVIGDDTIPKPGLVIEDGKMPSTPTYWQVPANANYRWMLYDFDFKTGKMRWERELKRGAPLTPRYHKNSYATETPVTDGQRVYVFHAPAGLLAAVDFSGRVVWTSQIDQPVTQAEGGPFGPGASPAIHGNRIFLVSDEHPLVWWLAAFDTQSGKPLWRIQEAKERGFGWSTPFVWENGARTELITVSKRRVNSYDLDGNPLWHLNGLSGSTTPTPFAANGLLYASSGYPGAFRPVYAIRPGARGDITLKEGETSNEFVAWSNSALATYLPSPIVYRDQLCSLYARGLFTCHDAKTGKEIYGRQRIDPQASGFSTSPWAYNGKIFLASEDGDVYVIEAGPHFKILHKNSMGEMIHTASPAIVQSSLIIRTVSSLWKIARTASQAGGKRTPEQMQASYEAHKGEFDYLLGDWEFTAVSREHGNFRGYWSAVRLDEGQILDEYRVVGDKGETYYVTSSLRNYNKVLDRWELVGADAGSGLQDVGTGRRVGAEMHIEQKFGVMSDKPSTWRIRYYNIQPDRFSWTADRSNDGGKTWETKHQTIEARRLGPPRSLGPLAPGRNAAASSVSQLTGKTASDSITGHWGADGHTFLELRFDGAGGVSGTAIWRGGSRPEIRTAIRSGTFDPKTGALKLEGEGPGRDGVMTKYTIEGRLENDALVGDYTMGNDTGGFRFTRR